MKIVIEKTDSDKIIAILSAIANEMPEQTQDALQVTRSAKYGIEITIEAWEPHQTDNQRSYYWKWNRSFADYCGCTPEEMHEELLCRAYGSETVNTRLGWRRRPTLRSSGASRIEYSKLIDTLIQTAAEMDFIVPPAAKRLAVTTSDTLGEKDGKR